MRYILTLTIVLLTACTGEAEEKTKVSKNFEVDRLFTHDGCTVYRFMDKGSSHYYVNCNGGTFSQASSYNPSTKTSRTVINNIPTDAGEKP
jgi:outer membrane biogenesis lipoprotein LolB